MSEPGTGDEEPSAARKVRRTVTPGTPGHRDTGNAELDCLQRDAQSGQRRSNTSMAGSRAAETGPFLDVHR
ncbi:hypothetical protein BRC90_10585 [Halobacteriales archaeon QS_4_69_34]|nr:MAG: hypothetical protein BRC90_10585 [Halobacteriales archaeon QS_4_69_34]